MPKDTEKKEKAVTKAKKVARSNKKGENRRRYRTHLKIRFYRPKTLTLSRKPKAPVSIKAALRVPKKQNVDNFVVIKYPLSTEKAMKKMEDENTMVFIVDNNATKLSIKKAFAQLYQVKVRSVNTLIRPDGKKKAYIRLSSESDSLTLANKIGII